MSSQLSLEYCVFGVSNPLVASDPIIEQDIIDRYFVITPNTTLKHRRGIFKYKEIIDSRDGVDSFHVQQFNADPQKDPLCSFVQLHGFQEAMSGEGVLVMKRRKLYMLDRVKVYYTSLQVQGHSDTNLTITGENIEDIQRKRAEFGLSSTNNLNYGTYLHKYVSGN